MDEILAAFLEDTREHLADIETDLLDIEELGDGGDSELVNKVFRTAHSIKGSAGFLGMDTIRDLSHKIESVLDAIRSGEMQPDPEVINIVLRAFDRLAELVDNHAESNEMDISEHTQTLTALLTDTLPEEERAGVTTKLCLNLPSGGSVLNILEHDLRKARKNGNYIYLVEYDLIHDVHRKGKTPIELMQFLEKSGLIIDCGMDIGAVGDLSGELSARIPFHVLYASILEPELAKAIFQVDNRYIHEILDEHTQQAESTTTPTLGACAPKEADAMHEDATATQAPPNDLDDLEAAFDAAWSQAGAVGANADASQAITGGMTKQTGPACETDTNFEAMSGESQDSGFVLDMDAPLPEAEEADALPPEAAQAADAPPLRTDGDATVLTLSGEATIARAAELKNALLQGLNTGSSLALDVAGITAADVTFLQLLHAAAKSAKARSIGLTLATPLPAPVLELIARAGLDTNQVDWPASA